MRNVRFALFGVLAFVFATMATSSAQQSDNARKLRQTPDTGVDDPLPPGQQRKIGERLLEGVSIKRGVNGVLIAQLDESFEDAVVAVVKADGSIAYTCLHGLDAASAHVKALRAPVAPTTSQLEEK